MNAIVGILRVLNSASSSISLGNKLFSNSHFRRGFKAKAGVRRAPSSIATTSGLRHCFFRSYTETRRAAGGTIVLA